MHPDLASELKHKATYTACGRVGEQFTSEPCTFISLWVFSSASFLCCCIPSVRAVRAAPLPQQIPRMPVLRECFQGSELCLGKETAMERVPLVHGGQPVCPLLARSPFSIGPRSSLPLYPAQCTPVGCHLCLRHSHLGSPSSLESVPS